MSLPASGIPMMGNDQLGDCVDAGYFYVPYVPLMTTEVSRRTRLRLRRYRPWGLLQHYQITDTRSIKSVWLSLWPPWRKRWNIDLGDDQALPDPATECVICLGRDPTLAIKAPMELWLWRDKYWVDTGRLDGWTAKYTSLDPNSFNPQKGILTKYGKKLLVEGHKYYGKITIKNV